MTASRNDRPYASYTHALISALRHERSRSQRILLTLGVDGRIRGINHQGCELLGWAKHELLGSAWIETCLPPAIREPLRHKFDGLIRGDLSVVENPVLTRSGEERLIEWHNTIMRNDAGQVVGTFSSGADITERVRAMQVLQDWEERTRLALEVTGVGIWDLDYATGTLRWSEALEAQYGLRPGTFEGTFHAFVARLHPVDRATVIDTVGQAAREGSDFALQHRIVRPDGSVRTVRGAGRVFRDVGGEPRRAIGVSQDVTVHERATIELSRLNATVQQQRLRVFKGAMKTVRESLGSLVEGLNRVRNRAEDLSAYDMQRILDRMIQQTSRRLTKLSGLERIIGADFGVGEGLEAPRPFPDRSPMIGIPRQRRVGEEVWRLYHPDGSSQSCAIFDNSSIGDGWEVQVLINDEPQFSRRCVDEAAARVSAESLRQEGLSDGFRERTS